MTMFYKSSKFLKTPFLKTAFSPRSFFSFIWYFASRIVLGAVVASFMLIFALRYYNPPTSTEMLRFKLSGEVVRYEWVDIEKISPHLIRAVIMSEDGQYCRHNGIDWHQVEKAWQEALEGAKKPRGASTITMQTAKNLFLWSERSYIRKALELPLAYLMNVMWSKRRQMEIYLDIVEWAPGVYGAKAAAIYHFKRKPHQLTATQAARLAAALPNPIVRRAGRPGPYTRKIANIIKKRMANASPWVRCVLK